MDQLPVKYYEKYSFLCTYEVQDPAHGAVSPAGQHSEIRDVSEEVQPANNKHSLLCRLLPQQAAPHFGLYCLCLCSGELHV